MKKLLIGLVTIVGLLVAAAFAIPFVVPIESYKTDLVRLVKAATGRDLRIDGPVTFSLLPRLALQASNVALSNPAGAATPDMLQLKTLDVTLRFFPLLRGAIEVEQIKLVEPTIDLEVDSAGHANWAFGSKTPKEQVGAPPAESATRTSSGMRSISFGDVSIIGGQGRYFDQRSGEKRILSDIDVHLALPDLSGPFAAKGTATWSAEPLTLDLLVAQPGALFGGGTSPITLSLSSRPVNFDFQGDATGATLTKLSGTTTLAVPSLRGLAAWLGMRFDAPGTGFGALNIKGKIAVEDSIIAFTDATLALDEIKATGSLTVDPRSDRPYLTGRLDIDKLDVNPYLAPEQGKTSGVGAKAPAASPSGQAQASGLPTAPRKSDDWSDRPLDFSGLRTADTDFDLTANEILYRKIALGRSSLALHLKNGRLEADLTEMALYQGKGEGKAIADGSSAVPTIDATFNLSSIAIQPLLRDAAGFEDLSGVGQCTLDIAGQGKTERDIVASLSGNGSLNLANGKIVGVNLIAFMENVASAVTGGQSGSNETAFRQLAGTYTITKGIVHNDDLRLISPELPVTGAGTIDLPRREVDYRLTPNLAGFVAVPLSITGSWDDLSYEPDLAALGKNIIKQPGKALDALKDQGSGAANFLKGLLGR